MVDDLGAIDDRILERLPNIKALFLNNGLQYDAAYSETPLCCPGRASFLTGQHTAHHGVTVNDARLLNPNNTIATAVHDDGYYTLMVGKYLNGAAQLNEHKPPGWDHVTMLNDWSSNTSSDWWVDDVPTSAGYFDRFIDESASDLLATAPANKPVFMWVTPHAPHKSAATNLDWEPDIEPQYAADPRCSGIKPWHPPNYLFAGRPDGYPLDDICRSLLTVDDMVGHLRDIATSEGRDPVWILMSDNGMAWGSDGYLLKNVPAADRLPFFVSGPGVAHGRTDALISNIDIGPTLADLAGTKMPKADGKSFVATFDGKGGGRKALLEDHPVGGPTGEGDVATGPWWGVRTPRWHLIFWNGVHLYDTVADPWEMDDVAAQNMDVARQLASIFNRSIDVQPSPSPSVPPTPTTSESPTPSVQPSETPIASAQPSPTPVSSAIGGKTPGPTPSPGRSAMPHPSASATGVAAVPDPGDTGSSTDGSVELGPAVLAGLVGLGIAMILLIMRPRMRPGRG